MNERVCKCGQPENSIRHSSATAKSVDAHQFMPSQPISPQSDEMLRFGIDALNGYVETNETLIDGPGFAPYRKWYAAEKARRERNVEAK